MKEYYCLLLNNCYDKMIHWVCPKYFSVLPNILIKNLTDLDLLEREFMNLDDTITTNEDNYHVLGSFPIFGEILEDGKMHDVVTGKVITYAKSSKEASGLSYHAKYRAYDPMVQELLTLLDEESKQRYFSALNDLEAYSKNVFYGINKPERHLALSLRNARLAPIAVIAKEENGQIIELVTKEKITLAASEDMITSKVSADIRSVRSISKETADRCQLDLIESGIKDYLEHVELAKTNSVKNYNNYVSLAKEHPKTKVKTK